jgi:tetratricopeptide (TPR) repeat protein
MRQKTAADWLAEGLDNLGLAWSADSESQLEADRRRALEAFEQGLALAPDDVTLARHRAEVLLAMGDWAEALDALVGLRARGVEDAALHEAVARCHRNLGALPAAIDEAKAALAAKPDNVELVAQRANDLLALGRFHEAREAFVQVLSDGAVTGVRRVDARVGFARALAGLGEDASDAWFSLVNDEEAAVTGGFAARAFVDALATSEALAGAFEVWLGAVEESAVRLRRVGDVLLRARRSAQAVRVAQRLVAVAPEDAHAWHLLGEALAQAGQLDEAIDAFETALDVWPEFLGAKARLGAVRAQRGRPAERWRLMGRDTFSTEAFVIDVFDSKRGAQRALQALEAREAAAAVMDDGVHAQRWIEPA